MPKKKKINTMHEKVANATFSFVVTGEALVALHNALAFTLTHKEEYAEELELCEHCLDAMDALRRQAVQILDYSEAYDENSKKLMN